jgi:lipopolysaccharide transport system ATP-binding protein
MSPIISVQGLSKRYRLGADEPALSLHAWLRPARNRGADHIWALRDVSFDVARGERIGIIGRNGAGKSTLLKILSRVVYPTEGEARIRGRVTSLLEVGTGFNDALSGRENIYLNAALHGLSRAEVDARLEDIIEFSEIRKFIDTPVKHYSSGMRMRLAFSVAAHLEPDVLMLDEVLAVGDLSFQKKCLERMNGLTSEGRTLLFVSHSPDAITRFCTRCLWIDNGRIRMDGSVDEVLSEYLKVMRGLSPTLRNGIGATPSAASQLMDNTLPGIARTELVDARIINAEGVTATTVGIDEAIGIEITYHIKIAGKIVEPAIHVRTEQQVMAFVAAYTDPERAESNAAPGRYTITAWIPPNLLNTGVYYVSIILVTPDPLERHATHENALSFHLHEPAAPTGTRGRYGRSFPGVVRPLLRWETKVATSSPDLLTQDAEA